MLPLLLTCGQAKYALLVLSKLFFFEFIRQFKILDFYIYLSDTIHPPPSPPRYKVGTSVLISFLLFLMNYALFLFSIFSAICFAASYKVVQLILLSSVLVIHSRSFVESSIDVWFNSCLHLRAGLTILVIFLLHEEVNLG